MRPVITEEELRSSGGVGKIFREYLGFMGPAKNTRVFYYRKLILGW